MNKAQARLYLLCAKLFEVDLSGNILPFCWQLSIDKCQVKTFSINCCCLAQALRTPAQRLMTTRCCNKQMQCLIGLYLITTPSTNKLCVQFLFTVTECQSNSHHSASIQPPMRFIQGTRQFRSCCAVRQPMHCRVQGDWSSRHPPAVHVVHW